MASTLHRISELQAEPAVLAPLLLGTTAGAFHASTAHTAIAPALVELVICTGIIRQCLNRFLGCLGLACSYRSCFLFQTRFQRAGLGGLVCSATLRENPSRMLRS